MFNAVLYNPAKPVINSPNGLYYRSEADPGFSYLSVRNAIFSYNRLERITFQTTSYLPVCEIVNESIPNDSTMGFMMKDGCFYQEYCFFGDTFQRKVIPLKMEDMAFSESAIRQHGVEYILYYKYPLEDILVPEDFSLVVSDPDKMLFVFAKD